MSQYKTCGELVRSMTPNEIAWWAESVKEHAIDCNVCGGRKQEWIDLLEYIAELKGLLEPKPYDGLIQ